MDRGLILCSSRPLPFGGKHITYTWQGGDVVTIDHSLFRDIAPHNPQEGELFWIGPYLLRVLSVDFLSLRIIACRERPIKARAIYLAYRTTRQLDHIYRILIVTLYVWGLATYDQGRIPTWRDVKGTARLAAWVDKRRDADLKRRIDALNKGFKDAHD